MYLGKDKTKRPTQPIAKLNVPDARRVLPKGLPCLYFTIRQGILTRKTLSETRQKLFLRKKEVETWHFLQQR